MSNVGSVATVSARLASPLVAIALEQPRGISSKLPFGTNKSIERLSRDAQLLAEVADIGVALGHGSLRQPKLGRRHCEGPTI